MACCEMIAATEKELKGLGVPFFGVREELIRKQGHETKEKDSGNGVKPPESGDGKIGEEELKGLRGKMVELLEDLCRD